MSIDTSTEAARQQRRRHAIADLQRKCANPDCRHVQLLHIGGDLECVAYGSQHTPGEVTSCRCQKFIEPKPDCPPQEGDRP